MTLYKVIETMKMLALKHPNINSACEGNIYDIMNANPQQKYATVIITQQSHTQDDTYDHYGFNIFYVDRLVDDMDSNRVQIQSTGKSMLANIIKSFCDEFDGECENINFQTFTERFADECAGVYCTITIDMVKDMTCTEKYWDESWTAPVVSVKNQNKSVVFTENGTYVIDYDAANYTGLGKVSVEVDVADLNGSYDEGYEDGKTDGIEEGRKEGIKEQKDKLESITIKDNGTYNKEDGYNKVVVEVPVPEIMPSLDIELKAGDAGTYRPYGYDAVAEINYSVLPNYDIDQTFTENGTYEFDVPAGFSGFGHATLNIDVQDLNGSYDDGYNDGYNDGVEEGTSNAGEIIAQTAQVLNITENGIYSTKYSKEDDFDTKPTEFEGNLIRSVSVNVVPKVSLKTTGMKLGYGTFTEVPDFVDFEGVADYTNMFTSCYNIKTIPLIDTSSAKEMNYMFRDCSGLITIPELDTSNVTTMTGMFYGCSKLSSIPKLNTSNVKSMYYMFYGCYELTSIPPLDTSNVTDIDRMFYGCSGLKEIPELDCGSVTAKDKYPLYWTSNNSTLTTVGGFKNMKYSWTNNYGLYRSTALTYESCINILNGLYDFTANGETPNSSQGQLKVNQAFMNQLTEEDKNIAISKGWTLQV